MDSFTQKVSSFIKAHNLIQENDTIVMGVSGGPDSVALFYVLSELRESLKLNLICVHVNHGLRKEAVEEAEYVSKLCHDNNVTFYLKECDLTKLSKEWKLGCEEAGRRVRYEAFNEALKLSGKEGKIAIAHNKNDRAETFLFNLFRGTGPKGLTSIRPMRDNVIRPLICVTRSEIEAYLNRNDHKYYIDKTNKENDFTRNRIRNILIPEAEKSVNNRAGEHVADASVTLTELFDFAEEEVNDIFDRLSKKSGSRVSFDIESFGKTHDYVKKNLILKSIEYLVPHFKDITRLHVEDVLDVMEKPGNKTVDLPYNIVAGRSYGELFLERRDKETETKLPEIEIKAGFNESVTGLGRVSVKSYEARVLKDIPEKAYTKYFDYDKIKGNIFLRGMKTQDFLVINKEGNRKKVSKYLKDEKVPEDMRNQTFLFADGDHVMWVVGHRISEYYKIDDKTETVLEIEVSKEE
jgi:tRNA(Ile)-lysidine synthase